MRHRAALTGASVLLLAGCAADATEVQGEDAGMQACTGCFAGKRVDEAHDEVALATTLAAGLPSVG